MKTPRKRTGRGAPTSRRNPPRKATSPPRQQKEAAKTLKDWNSQEEIELLVFYVSKALEHIRLLAYHAMWALCKLVVKLLVEYCLSAALKYCITHSTNINITALRSKKWRATSLIQYRSKLI